MWADIIIIFLLIFIVLAVGGLSARIRTIEEKKAIVGEVRTIDIQVNSEKAMREIDLLSQRADVLIQKIKIINGVPEEGKHKEPVYGA
jgi:hypothetical protein